MQFSLKPILILLFFFTCINQTQAQKIYLDSMNHLLVQKNLSQADRINILCKLAKANFEQNLPLSFKQANEALHLGQTLTDGRGKAMAFATMIHLFVWKKDLKKAYSCRDSAMYYAQKTKDPVTLGFVWFRNGWLDLINDDNEQSARKFLKALDYFKGNNASEYESTIYHYLASFYSYGNDPAKQKKYANLCYQAAIESKQVDALNNAYFTIGQTYFDRFRVNQNNRALLDSALLVYKKSLLLAKQQEARLILRNNTAAIALNTANAYFQYFPANYRDSAEKYLNVAIGIATKTNLHEVLLNCYGMKSEYAMRDGRLNEAENILLDGLAKADGVISMPLTKARVFEALSKIAEKKGNSQQSLSYLKQYFELYKQAFNEEKINSIARIEAQYQSEKKEQEIAYLQKEASFSKKLTIFYVTLGFMAMAVLLFFLRSYNFKLKAAVKKQELVDQQKTAAELRAQLKEAEAIRLQTEQVLLKERENRLQKEVMAGTLQIEEKNELLELLSGKVDTESHLSFEQQIKRILNQQRKMDKDFEEHKTDFFETNPAFFERLQQQANQSLTRLDLKYCSYMLMGLSNKEVSARLGIEPKSVRMSRYRIKQKLGLGKDDDLNLFLQQQSLKH